MSQRRPLIAGNWKMHKTVAESLALVKELAAKLDRAAGNVEVAIAPPFTALAAVGEYLKASGRASKLGLAAQNCHWEDSGAYTGEISPPMLVELGCRYVVLGHSERRQYFGETDETVNLRTRAAMTRGLVPIVCVGETLAEREKGATLDVIGRQLKLGLAGISVNPPASLVIAYEPVWAIGTGQTATTAQAQEVHAFIRSRLASALGDAVATGVRIQYGGSVKPENASELLSQPDIDGALVGGASLKAADFVAIVQAGA